MSRAQSPYEAVLGDRFGELHPKLQSYFSGIPAGKAGAGDGVFDTVGTPRGWLRAMIRLLGDRDVLFPVWERNVPFTLTNRSGQDAGRSSVEGKRNFALAKGNQVMHDLIVATPEGLVDVLGQQRRILARFAADIVDGEFHLTSTRVAVRVGTRQLWIPRPCAPRVTLIERYSDTDDRQHVAVVVSVPLIGRVYEYAGWFRYQLKEGKP